MKRVIILGRAPYSTKTDSWVEIGKKGEAKEFEGFTDEMVVGIEWKQDGKAMIIEVPGGYAAFNADRQRTSHSKVMPSVKDHLNHKDVKVDMEKVIIFKSKAQRLKWFAKKSKKKKRKQY